MELDGDLLTNLSTFDSNLLIRFESFKDWPKQQIVSKEKLAGAGFTFLNMHDIVECKSCGVKIRNWNNGDDPYMDHIKFRPECEFVHDKANKPYIEHLKWEKAWMNYDKLCKFCKKKPSSAVLLPCHHAAACFDCAKQDKCCGKCHGTIRGFIGFTF